MLPKCCLVPVRPQKTLAMGVAAGGPIAVAVDRTKIDLNSVAARTLFQAISGKKWLET